MTGGKVRWGIIGPGRIAHSFARDITAVDNAELVAVAARDGERARAFRAQIGLGAPDRIRAAWLINYRTEPAIRLQSTFH